MVERWLPVPGYEGFYEVSDAGGVRSVARDVRHWRGGVQKRLGRAMTQTAERDGYRVVHLCRDGKPKMLKVHRLVALAFLGEPESPDLIVCHRDGVPDHNTPTNLYWGTHTQNVADAFRHGTRLRAAA